MKKSSKKQPTLDRIPDGVRVASLDVSSTATGWAICCRTTNSFVVERFGVIRPTASWVADRRILTIIERLHSEVLVRQSPPLRVIMEWQSHLRAAGNRSANGLATLGKAQGAVWWSLYNLGIKVEHVSERDWTKVNGWNAKKVDRAKLIRLACPEYREAVERDADLDPGLDIADAIGIAFWRLSR